MKGPCSYYTFLSLYGFKLKELRKDIVDMENLQNIFVQVIRKPKRKVIMKRGIKAEDFLSIAEKLVVIYGAH